MKTRRNTEILVLQKNTKPVKSKKKIWIGLGVVAATVGAFFGIRSLVDWNNKRKDTPDFEIDETDIATVKTETTNTSSNPKPESSSTSWLPRTDEFPLKKGSKGERVKAIQQSLIAKYGSSILPKYGADGDFGSEMQNALQKNGYPSAIDESTYNVLVKTANTSNVKSIAQRLYAAVVGKSHSAVITALKEINNIAHFTEVGKAFTTAYPFFHDKKLAQELFDTFPGESQRDPIRMQLLRIGLKFDGKAWTLSGLSGNKTLLITTTATDLVDPKRKVKVRVPANMVVGYRLQEKNGLTLFKTIEKNKKLIVQSITVKIYEND